MGGVTAMPNLADFTDNVELKLSKSMGHAIFAAKVRTIISRIIEADGDDTFADDNLSQSILNPPHKPSGELVFYIS